MKRHYAVIFSVLLVPLVLWWLLSSSASNQAKVLLHAMTGWSSVHAAHDAVAGRLRVPQGFRLNLFAGDLANARMLHITEAGDLLLTRPRHGEVVLLRGDNNGDGQSDSRRVLLSGLNKPHDVTTYNGWLYVAESDAVGRVRFDDESGALQGSYEALFSLDDSGIHWTKTLAVGPDGWLYLSSGSSCNVCEEANARRATVMRFKPDGSALHVYASGLRNSVGFDWAPWSGELYATDNGRDMLGDNFPPCELNRLHEGGFYGWPYINGDGVPDPDFGSQMPASLNPIAPVHQFAAHNAPLGIYFIRQPQWQAALGDKTALVALHGSWNRSIPDGYRVVSLHWRKSGGVVAIEERDFVTGFLTSEGEIIGRPVDIAEGEGGALFISDDYAGAVYRVVLNHQ